MAYFYVNEDGTVNKKKKKLNPEFVVELDGSITVPTPSKSKKEKLPTAKTNNQTTTNTVEKTQDYKSTQLQQMLEEEQKKKQKEEDNKRLQELLKDRYEFSKKTTTDTKPSPFQEASRTTNNPNNIGTINQQMQNIKNYPKNDEIREIVARNSEDSGKKILNNISNFIQEAVMLKSNFDRAKPEDKLKTIGNAGTNLLHGAGKTVEDFYDFSLNASSNINTTLNEKFGIQTKEQAAAERQAAADIIKRDLTSDFESRLGFDEEAKQKWEEGSVIKRDNLGGKVMEGIGEMIPQVLIGKAMGGTPTQWANLSNSGKILTSLPSTMTIGTTSYGGALEEAYNGGATVEQANKYALGSAITEIGTEWISGGVPGLPQTGFIDKWTDKIIDSTSNSMAKFLLKQGFTFVGEGGEEGLSEIIKPFLKNLTYTKGEKINWKEVWEAVVVGGLVGDILELPGNLSNYRSDVEALKQDLKLNKQEALDAVQTEGIQSNLNENTQNNINIPTNENVSQNGLKLPTNTYQNTNYNEEINPMENLQEFNEQRQEKIEKQQTEETNKKIDKLQEQVENLNKSVDKTNELEQYNEKEIKDYSNGKVKLVQNNSDVKKFIDTAKKIPSNAKLYFGKISEKLSNKIESMTGVNLKNYNISLKADDIRHIFKQHGTEREYLRGQVPITDSDFELIPEIVSNYDTVEKTGTTNDGKPVITFTKKIGDKYFLVNYVSDKHHNLEVQTMWKQQKKNSATADNTQMSPIPTPEVHSGTSSYDNNNTTNRTKSQASLPSQYNMQQKKNNIPTKKEVNTKSDKVSMPMAKKDDVLKVESKRIAKQINDTGGFDLKQRSWIETSTESDALKDKVFIEDLDKGMINYVVQSNKKSLDSANKHLKSYGYEKSLDYVNNLLQSDGLPKASDVALMQRMIQEAAKRGDVETVQNLVMDTAILGTDLGQATQALSMIKKLTPEGQLTMYTKLVQRAKARGEKSFQNVEITPEMVQNILEAYNEDGTYDQDDLNARVEQFKQDLANQMKSTAVEKIDAWRYLSMLGNPKTHIRNMVSNIAMTGTIKVKNAMARTLETVLPVQNRTKTWKRASKEVEDFARKTTTEMKDIITGENKYNEKSAIESKKQIFKTKALEKISNFNSNALEAEDWLFSKSAFRKSFQEYLIANGIRTNEDIKNNPKVIEKAKNYAVQQAEIATFRQYSKLASTINQIERKNKGARLAVQALVPFKKTPINVAKAGVNYSPLGLIKSMTYDAFQLKQGNIEASQFIDNISQGLTGTSLTLLGYALAKAGILTGSGGDDKDDKYDKQLGNTGYSLKLGGKSYSVSWLSPVAMPLLVGSNAYEQLEEEKEWDMNVVSDTLAKTLDPLNEMSFMQSLTNAINSYGSGTDKIKGAGESTLQSYVGQFFPTLFSQIAATTDDTKRSTKASANSKYKFGEQTVRSVMYKLPGLRQQLEPATDIWGNEKKQSNNIVERAFESFLAPYSKSEDISTDLDKEIKRVYSETGESGVVPGVPYAYVRYKNETYRMSANEYTKYKKTYGQNANKYLNELIKSDSYKSASDNMKAKMIDNVYDYAKAEANEQYFKGNDIEYTSDTLKELNKLKDLNINKTTLAEYVANKTQVSSIRNSNEYTAEQKKRQVSDILTNSNLTNNQLAYLYGKYYSTEDKLKALTGANVPIKEFIKYDLTDFTSDYNSRGKAITGSREKKVINYVNSLNLSVAQKALLIKMEYNSYKKYDNQIVNYVKSSGADYLDKAYLLKKSGFKNYDKEIINYVKQHYNTVNEREEVLKNLGFTVRNGRVY